MGCWHARLAFAAGLALLQVSPLAAEDSAGANLDSAERALQERKSAIEKGREEAATLGGKAEGYRAEVDVLRIQAIDVAAKTQSLERSVGQIEARVATLAADEAKRRAALEAGRPSRAKTISAMLRLSRRPPQALMLAPNSAVDATRSALLMAAVSKGLEGKANALRTSLHEIVLIQAELAAERERLDETTRELGRKRAALDGLIAEKVALERKAEAGHDAAESRIRALVREARDLEDLIAKLEVASSESLVPGAPLPPPRRPDRSIKPSAGTELAAPAEPPDTAAPPAEVRTAALDREAMQEAESPRQGAFALPAEGKIVGYFGSPTAPGVTAKGLSIATRDGASVVAPFAGKVVFAGPFRDYGQLLIIAHGEGYHTLLAGLGRIDTAVGRWVLAGEPIGNMSSSPEMRPQLYLELRHKGRPVNPLPWLATGPIKSSGS